MYNNTKTSELYIANWKHYAANTKKTCQISGDLGKLLIVYFSHCNSL